MEDEARYLLERLRGEGSNEALSEFQNVCALAKLDREEPKQASYWSMLTGIGTGKAHTARRVQLVVWLQILQEWIGIAGITIYGPEIFTIAGISSKDRQWVSGLNNITYMVSLPNILLLSSANQSWSSLLSSVSSPWTALVAVGLFTGAPSGKESVVSLLAGFRM